MFQLKDLLDKFKSLEDPKESRGRIAEILNITCKIGVLDSKSLEIKKGIVWLKVHPAVKQRIIMNKQKCLEELKKSLPTEVIVDIR